MRATTRIQICMIALILFSMQAFALGLGTFEKEFRYTADQVSTIQYYIVMEETENMTINLGLIGDIEQYGNFRIDNYWYSTKSDKQNLSLTREFDLRNISTATLKFNTRYNIEYGWDFGYVEISTNNGSSWTHLNLTSTTTYVDPYYAANPGDAPTYYNLGQAAYTGATTDWNLETADITPFAGNVVLIRFRYVTDEAYSEHGWLVDDISVPEIGFLDDVQSGNKNWTTNGWRYNVLYITNSSKLIPVKIDYTIPSNYTSNGTEQKIVVTHIPGADQDYNPGQSSVAHIVAILPPLVRNIPTPPSGGGGGGGGLPPESYSNVGDALRYYVSLFSPQVIHEIRASLSDTPLTDIILQITYAARNVEIKIIPLRTKPDNVQDLPGVYRFFSIETINIDYSSIKKAVLHVLVQKDWMQQNHLSENDIVVARFSGGKWSDLPTIYLSFDGKNYKYEATTPGFSVFAVRKKTAATPATLMNQTAKPNISQVKPLTIVTGNVSVNETVEEIKDIIQQKTNATEKEVEEFFAQKVQIISKEPEVAPQEPPREEITGSVMLYIFISVAAIAAAAIIGSIVREHRKRKHANNKRR